MGHNFDFIRIWQFNQPVSRFRLYFVDLAGPVEGTKLFLETLVQRNEFISISDLPEGT